MKTRLKFSMAFIILVIMCILTEICTAQIITNPFGVTFNYIPADTTLPERYERKDLFRLKWGNKPGQLGNDSEYRYSPGGIAVDKKGYIYVLDFYNSRINKYDQTGRFIKQIFIKYKNAPLIDTKEEIGRAIPYSRVNHLGIEENGLFMLYSWENGKIYFINGSGKYIKEYKMKTRYDSADMIFKNGGREDYLLECRFIDENMIVNHSDKINKNVVKADTFILPEWATNQYKKECYPFISYGGGEIYYIDNSNNIFVRISASESRNKDDSLIGRKYSMLNKYDPNKRLLAQIQVTEDVRFNIMPDGNTIYALYSEIRTNKGAFVSKWIKKQEVHNR